MLAVPVKLLARVARLMGRASSAYPGGVLHLCFSLPWESIKGRRVLRTWSQGIVPMTGRLTTITNPAPIRGSDVP